MAPIRQNYSKSAYCWGERSGDKLVADCIILTHTSVHKSGTAVKIQSDPGQHLSHQRKLPFCCHFREKRKKKKEGAYKLVTLGKMDKFQMLFHVSQHRYSSASFFFLCGAATTASVNTPTLLLSFYSRNVICAPSKSAQQCWNWTDADMQLTASPTATLTLDVRLKSVRQPPQSE